MRYFITLFLFSISLYAEVTEKDLIEHWPETQRVYPIYVGETNYFESIDITHLESVKWAILQSKRHISIRGEHLRISPLYRAIDEKADEIIIRLILENGGVHAINEINNVPELETALIRAVRQTSLDRTKLLLEAGADVNIAGGRAITPLHYAVARNSEGLVSLLLGFGARVTAQDRSRNRPIHYAARFSVNLDIAESLLKRMEWIDYLNREGKTALHYAAIGGKLELGQLLVKYGAKVDYSSARTRMTALHYAAEVGDLPFARFLLNNGAEIDVKNNLGLTPADLARTNNHWNILRLLTARQKINERTNQIDLFCYLS